MLSATASCSRSLVLSPVIQRPAMGNSLPLLSPYATFWLQETLLTHVDTGSDSWELDRKVSSHHSVWPGVRCCSYPWRGRDDTVLRADVWPSTFILCLVTEDLTQVDRGHDSADLKATLGRKQSIS